MKKLSLGVFTILTLVFLGAQFVRPEFTNPAIVEGMEIDGNSAFSPEVRKIIKNSCADCHSNETEYPWYSGITPVNWWLKSHIDDGRAHMNFSTDPAGEEWDEICKEVMNGKMPMPSYTWGHPEAVLSDADKKTLCDWSKALGGSSGDGESDETKKSPLSESSERKESERGHKD